MLLRKPAPAPPARAQGGSTIHTARALIAVAASLTVLTTAMPVVRAQDAFSSVPVGDALTFATDPAAGVSPLAQVNFTASGGTLLFSDDPETVPEPGILYQDTVTGAFRVFLYHVDGTASPMYFIVNLTNNGSVPVTVALPHTGIAGPSTNYLATGKAALLAYLKSGPAEDLTVPAGATVPMNAQLVGTAAQQNQLVNAILAGDASGPLQVTVLATSSLAHDPTNVLAASPGRALMRGTFPSDDRAVNFAPPLNSPALVQLAGNHQGYDGWLTGTSAVDGGQAVADVGNYGLIYSVSIQPAPGENNLGVLLNPRGGPFAGVLTAANQEILAPADHTFMQAIRPYEASLVGISPRGATATLSYGFMPPGGSELPVDLLLMPFRNPSQLAVSAPSGPVVAGQPFSLTVTPEDPTGAPVTPLDQTVQLALSGQGGSSYTWGTADVASSHVFSGLVLTQAGHQQASVTEGSLSGQSPTFAVVSAPAQRVALAGPASVDAGASAAVAVKLLDPYGNVATGYTGTVTLSSSDPSARLPGPITFTSQNAGRQTVDVSFLTQGQQTLTAHAAGGFTARMAVTVGSSTPGSVNLVLTGLPATAVAGQSLTVTAEVYANGGVDTAASGPVTLAASDLSAQVPAAVKLTQGVATFPVTFHTAGAQTLRATWQSQRASASTLVAPGPTASLALTPSAGTVVAGVPFSVAVTSQDLYGNRTQDNGTVALMTANRFGGEIEPPAVTLRGGMGVSTGWVLTRATTYTILGSQGQMRGETAVAVTAGSLASLRLGLPPTTIQAGVEVAVTISGYDRFGNLDTGLKGPVDLSASTTALQVTTPGVIQGGQETVGVTLRTVGRVTVTATDPVRSVTASIPLLVTPGPVASLTVLPQGPVSLKVGASQQFSAGAVDSYGDPTGGAVTWSIDSQGGRGMISDQGVLRATAPGGLLVVATQGTLSRSVQVQIQNPSTQSPPDRGSGAAAGPPAASYRAPAQGGASFLLGGQLEVAVPAEGVPVQIAVNGSARHLAGVTLSAFRIRTVPEAARHGSLRPLVISMPVLVHGSGVDPFVFVRVPSLGTWVAQPTRLAAGWARAVVPANATIALGISPRVKRFTDAVGSWAWPQILELESLGIVTGVSATRFAPEAALTRAQMAKFLVLVDGVRTASSTILLRYRDGRAVATWARSVMATALASRLLSGYPGGMIHPDLRVTRVQAAVMLSRLLPSGGRLARLRFTDTSAIAHWAIYDVRRLVGSGVIHGLPSGRFAPAALVTRAQLAAMLIDIIRLRVMAGLRI